MQTARFSVQDKSILITGATGSLGSVAARALAAAGARLTLTGGNASGLAQLVDEAGSDDVAVVTRRPDTPADAQAMVEVAVAGHGRLDGVLVASGMNLVALSISVEVMNALLLPIVLGFLYMLAIKALPEPYKLKGAYAWVVGAIVAVTAAFGVYAGLSGAISGG